VRSIRPEAFGLIAAFGIPPGLAGAANLDSLVPSASSGNNLGDNRVSIPLELSPGIAGVEPELALQYSSRAGLSEFGFGWSLPISHITLDLSGPSPWTEPPRFRLDGRCCCPPVALPSSRR
jgi:hypothetical protein